MKTGKLYLDLVSILNKEKVSDLPEQLEVHSCDSSFHAKRLPDAVVFPETTGDVIKIIKYAYLNNIPVTAWGAGSSLEGNSIPVAGGISLDMKRMKRIVKFYEGDMQVKVQPGIVGKELNTFLSGKGLFFPAFPGSADVATVGGMVSTNAGGMYGTLYGVVGDWVLGLTVVTGKGELMQLGSRSIKSVAGYDLKRLITGSDGTLGIITEILFKLKKKPATTSTFIIYSEKEEKIIETSTKILQKTNPAALEFLNVSYINLINKVKPNILSKKPTLIVEFHGNKEEIEIYKKNLQTICKKQQVFVKSWLQNIKDQDIWEIRKSVRPVLKKQFKESGVITADIGIPSSSIFLFLKAIALLAQKYNQDIPVFGHLGDWNFHVWIMYDVFSKASFLKAQKINTQIVEIALNLEGTSTAEHGIGIGKRKFLVKEHGDQMHIYKEIKQIFDPKGILNPGKMLS